MHCGHETFRNATRFELEKRALHITERVSHGILAGACFISVRYDLQLIATLALRMTGQEDSTRLARLIVTAIPVGLGVAGTLAGLRSSETIEKDVVTVSLSRISALPVGLAWHNAARFAGGDWSLPTRGPSGGSSHVARMLMGLLIVVQGFETSRFLGAEHPAAERIRSMRRAQWISSAVDLIFIALITALFRACSETKSQDVTVLISIAGSIVPVLGTLVASTAIGSQFTAATADEAGCSGLLETPVSRILPGRFIYAVVASFAILVTCSPTSSRSSTTPHAPSHCSTPAGAWSRS